MQMVYVTVSEELVSIILVSDTVNIFIFQNFILTPEEIIGHKSYGKKCFSRGFFSKYWGVAIKRLMDVFLPLFQVAWLYYSGLYWLLQKLTGMAYHAIQA